MLRIGLYCIGVGAVVSIVSAERPLTPQSPVIETYHGTTVVDPFRWLEDSDNPAVQRWSDQQNTISRRFLDSLPDVDALRQEVSVALSAESARYNKVTRAGGRLFALKHQPPHQQPVIVVMSGWQAAADARTVVDPNVIDPSGNTTIDWYQVAPDGRQLAVSLSVGGTELGNLSVYDVQTGETVFEPIERVNSGTAGGSVAWEADGKGFYYTRHFQVDSGQPDDGRVYQRVYYHRLGTDPATDRYELGEGFPEIAEIQLRLHASTGHLLATVQEGDGGDFAHYLRSPAGEWTQFSHFGDGIKQAVFGQHDQLYVVSLQEAPRGKILSMPLDQVDVAQATLVVDQTEATIVTGGTPFWGEETVLPTPHRLYVVYQLGGPSEVRAFDLQGQPQPAVPQLEIGAVHGLISLDGDDFLFGNASYLQPNTFYQYAATANASHKTSLASAAPVSMDEAVVLRSFARSVDGTRVPLNIIMPRGTPVDGHRPCVVRGYGGYGVNNEPRYSSMTALLVRHGVIVVETNIRGGGEYGERWHRQGNLTHKQNVFDDFAACVRYMVDENYTRPERLGIMGGSNGGLLMGATLTQHPERVRAVVAFVGIYDMLRVELSPNGAFNVTEFGTVQDKDQFEALYSYSPYHNVIDGVSYPATLFLTGANDPRVDPMQSRKMTARLQSASLSEAPILLRTSASAGHGGGHSLNERIEQTVDVLAFLLHYLQVR